LGTQGRFGVAERTDGGDARVLPFDPHDVGARLELSHARGAELRPRAPRHLIEHAWELQHGQSVAVHLPASSSRAIALMALPSARPLSCGITFPITAPTLFAPAAIAARTAARISSG